MTKRLFFTVAISTVVMVVGFSTALAQTDEVKAVTDVMLREAVAVEKGDLGAIDKIWANTEDVSFSRAGTPISVGVITAIPISPPNLKNSKTQILVFRS